MDTSAIAFFAALGLVSAAIALVATAFQRRTDGVPRRRGPRIAGAIAAVAVALFLVLWFFAPGIVERRIREATDLTYKTFRDKIGKVPDRVTIDATDCSQGDEGWKYRGTAEFNDRETWDVTVTSTSDRSRRQTNLHCYIERR